MKKLLVASTALVAVAAVSSAQAADPVKLNIGGFMNQWVGFADNENDNTVTNNYNSVGTYSDAEIYFRGSTKLDNGLTVSVNIDTERSGASDGVSDDTFLAVSSDSLGTLKVGSTKGVGYGMSHKHSDVGIGLSDTDATAFVQNAKIAAAVTNVRTAEAMDLDTLTTSTDGHGIFYTSPNFGGVQVAVSYALVEEANALVDLATDDNDAIWNYGISYNGEFSGVSLGLDIVGEKTSRGGIGALSTTTTGTSASGALVTTTVINGYDSSALRYGASVGVAGFTIGGAYISEENYNGIKDRDSNAWEAGVKYATGPYAVSLGYLNRKAEEDGAANAKEDEAKLWVASGSYDLGAGVSFKGSVFNLETDDASTSGANNTLDNDNWGVAVGLAVSF